MQKGHILIVEDSAYIAKVLEAYGQQGGFNIQGVSSDHTGYDSQSHQVEIMPADADGIELCKQIRQFSDLPITMIFTATEKAGHLHRLETDNRIEAVGIQLVPEQFAANYQGRPLGLTRIEFRILELLVRRPNRVFSREQLMQAARNESGKDITDRTIDTHIKNIRHKIKQISPEFNAIESVYGVGYRLSGG